MNGYELTQTIEAITGKVVAWICSILFFVTIIFPPAKQTTVLISLFICGGLAAACEDRAEKNLKTFAKLEKVSDSAT